MLHANTEDVGVKSVCSLTAKLPYPRQQTLVIHTAIHSKMEMLNAVIGRRKKNIQPSSEINNFFYKKGVSYHAV